VGRQNESTNCGEEVCPKTAKTSLRDVSLACLIGESYDFAVYRVVKGVFRAESDSKFGSALAKCIVDALFRLKAAVEIGGPTISPSRRLRLCREP
jgi:hypothetical protein